MEHNDEATYTVSPADLLHYLRLPSTFSAKKLKGGIKRKRSEKACKSKALAKGEAGTPDMLSSAKPLFGLTKDKIMTKPQFISEFDASDVPLSSLQFLSF